jgi:opacity protein-like surface antigen
METNSGKISITKVNVAKELKIQNDFGEIELTQAMAGSYDLHTNSGTITIDGAKGSTFAGDFGVRYKLGRHTFGATVQHVGPGYSLVEESFNLPMTVRAGASSKFFEDRLTAALDISKSADNDATVHAGAEYQLTQVVALRGGYRVTPGNTLDVDGITGLTGGLGIAIRNFNLDYGFMPFGDLGAAHRVSLSFHFAQQN